MDIEDFMTWSLGVLGLAAIIAIGFLLGAVITRDSQVTFCYPSANDTKVYLKGHRDWTDDLLIGTFNTVDETRQASVRIGCPFLRTEVRDGGAS